MRTFFCINSQQGTIHKLSWYQIIMVPNYHMIICYDAYIPQWPDNMEGAGCIQIHSAHTAVSISIVLYTVRSTIGAADLSKNLVTRSTCTHAMQYLLTNGCSFTDHQVTKVRSLGITLCRCRRCERTSRRQRAAPYPLASTTLLLRPRPRRERRRKCAGHRPRALPQG